MQCGVLLLDAAIPASPQRFAIGGEQRRADWDATLAEAHASFLQRDLEQLAICHGRRNCGSGVVSRLAATGRLTLLSFVAN